MAGDKFLQIGDLVYTHILSRDGSSKRLQAFLVGHIVGDVLVIVEINPPRDVSGNRKMITLAKDVMKSAINLSDEGWRDRLLAHV